MKPVRVISTCIAIATLGAVAPSTCLAQARASTTGELTGSARKAPEYLASIPDDVDAVLAFRSLAELRSSPMGAFCVKLLDAEALSRVREGWSDLARAMGLSPSDAFDAVMGGRVVLALRRTENALPDWSIQASVDAKTEELLRKRLKVAPRTIVGGQTIYAVERGALELTVARSADSRRSARIVLAPAESRLFEEIIRGRDRGQKSVVETPMGQMIYGAPSGDVLLLGRLRERTDAWAALVGGFEGNVFEAKVRGSLSNPVQDAQGAPGWSSQDIESIAKGAHIAIFESGNSAISEIGVLFKDVLPSRLMEMLEANENLTGREVAVLRPNKDGAPVIVSAIELANLESGAKLADDAMDEMLGLIGLEPRRFGGVAPLAVRRVEQSPISLSWLFAPHQNVEDPRAWWIYSTGPDGLDAARVEFASIVDEPNGLRAAAYLQPAALLRSFADMGAPIPNQLDAFTLVESVEWVETGSDERTLDAKLAIRFVAPPSGSEIPASGASRPAFPER